MKPRPTLLLPIALLFALSPASAVDSREILQSRTADRQALEQAIADGRVATSPPRPGLTLYVGDAGITVSTWLAEVVDHWLPGFGRLADWFLAASWGLLVAVLVVVSVIVGIGLVCRWWGERSRPAPSVALLPSTDERGPFSRWPAERWEEEVRRRLAAGDVTAAVEALWWWLASVLSAGGVEPSWTSGELIARAGRADLKPQIRRLDRMIYGPEAPPAEDVRHFFRDLRGAA